MKTVILSLGFLCLISCNKDNINKSRQVTLDPFVQIDIYGAKEDETVSVTHADYNGKEDFVILKDSLGREGTVVNANSFFKCASVMLMGLDTSNHFTLDFFRNGKLESKHSFYLKLSSPNRKDIRSFPHKIDSVSIDRKRLNIDTAVMLYHAADRIYNPYLVESSVESGLIWFKYKR